MSIVYMILVGLFFLGIVFLFLKKESNLFVLFFPYIYSYASIFISSLYLECFPSYIYEQGVYSYFNLSSAFLVVLLAASFWSCWFSYKKFMLGYIRVKSSNVSLSSLVAISLLVFALIIHVLWSGSAFSNNNITKFNFWTDFAKIQALSVFNWILYLILFYVGARGAYFNVGHKVKKVLSILIVALSICYYLSWGNKFSSLVMVVCMYYIPGLIKYSFVNRRRYKLKTEFYFLLPMLVATMGGAIYSQYEAFQSRGLDVHEQLIERVFVLQGHVWWGIYNFVYQFGANYSSLYNELFGVDGNIKYIGMERMMSILAPNDLFYSYMDNGVQFTGGYPAILVLIFGFLGAVVVSAILFFFLGMFFSYTTKLIASGANIRLYAVAFLYLTMTSFFQHGTFVGFVNWKFIIVVIALVLFELVIQSKKVGQNLYEG